MTLENVDIIDDSIVIHFDSKRKQINAYTLASTLVALADAAKAANEAINPGYDVEITVEAVGPGSFRTKIRALYKKGNNLFSKQIITGIIIGILVNFIYERTLQNKPNVNVQINTDEVIIQSSDEKIVVPRVVYDATRTIEKNLKVTTAINRTFHAISNDPDIDGLGFVSRIDSPKPEVIMTRETIALAATNTEPEPDERIISENVELQIIKAILERGPRKWEFMWRGVKINAPITHNEFYNHFDAHRITIAPGDVLRVRLHILQHRNPQTGIYSNQTYEVSEVFEHIPRLYQPPLQQTNLH